MLDKPELEAAEGGARTLRLSGRRIGFAVYGAEDGAPVFALHGTPGSRLMFALADGLARERGLKLIAPERPGCGLSDYCACPSLRDSVSDLEQLADALGIGRFALVVVSGGGPYGVAAAAALPERVRFLALVSPVGPLADLCQALPLSRLHEFVFRRLPGLRRGPEALFALMRFMVRRAPNLARKGITRRAPVQDRAVLAREEVAANLIEALKEGLRPGVKGSAQDFRLFCAAWGIPLADITVPAIVWQGSDDHIVPAQAAYRLAEAMPNCRLDVIHGAGHYWVFDHFDSVLDAVEASLKA